MRYAIIIDNGTQKAVVSPFHTEQGAKDFRDTQIDHNHLRTEIVEYHSPKEFVSDAHWEAAREAARKVVR